MRKPIIAANWKMHKTAKGAEDFLEQFKPLVVTNKEVDIVLCVPFTLLSTVSQGIKGSLIALGAQNMYPEEKGAFTGEIAPGMLLEFNTKYVIIGHSERREIFGETDEFIKQKVNKALEVGLTPILCVGETLEEREKGFTEAKCRKQIEAVFKGLDKNLAQQIVIAYEPIWAIGTGITASSEDAEETIAYIRKLLAGIFDEVTAEAVRIQYGGSVKPGNIKELMAQPNIDGALVGGASLEPESFAKIVNFKE
ncbi:MAG: triosephosphate isomerase [Clostridia bacterium]|nr:triosephosphate isomerase [Clostridia bacterium]MDN5321900.1 triosephosphate isomerase [Clostridia bacterium]